MSISPDIAFLCSDPELGAQAFTVTRRTIGWEAGRPVTKSERSFRAVGNIQSPTPEELRFFPEGEKPDETKVVYTQTMLHLTEGEDVSDRLLWRGHWYRLVRVDRWNDWGYCVAYAARE